MPPAPLRQFSDLLEFQRRNLASDRPNGVRWTQMPNDARHRLNELRDGLLRLHTTLLASQRAAYERDVERIVSTGQYFNLVMNDAQFAWLRELSRFIVEIDELLDRKKPEATPDADQWIGQARARFSPAEDGGPFARPYFEAMQRDPGVVLAHGEMMRVFAALEG